MGIYQILFQIEDQILAAPTVVNQTIVSGGSGNFYLASNPSGFITGVDTSQLMTISGGNAAISGATGNCVQKFQTGIFLDQNSGQFIQTELNLISGATGLLLTQFYPLSSNPSGYLLSSQTGSFLSLASGNLFQSEIIALSGATGILLNVFYPSGQNPSGYITSGILTGYVVSALNQTGATLLNLLNNYYLNTNPSGYINSGQTGQFGTAAQQLLNTSGIAVHTNLINALLSGTGNYYPKGSNPSGYITGITGYVPTSATGNFVTNTVLSTSGFITNSLVTLTTGNTVNFNNLGNWELAYNTNASLLSSLTINLPSITTSGAQYRYITAGIATLVTVSGNVKIIFPLTSILTAPASFLWIATSNTGSFVRVQ